MSTAMREFRERQEVRQRQDYEAQRQDYERSMQRERDRRATAAEEAHRHREAQHWTRMEHQGRYGVLGVAAGMVALSAWQAWQDTKVAESQSPSLRQNPQEVAEELRTIMRALDWPEHLSPEEWRELLVPASSGLHDPRTAEDWVVWFAIPGCSLPEEGWERLLGAQGSQDPDELLSANDWATRLAALDPTTQAVAGATVLVVSRHRRAEYFYGEDFFRQAIGFGEGLTAASWVAKRRRGREAAAQRAADAARFTAAKQRHAAEVRQRRLETWRKCQEVLPTLLLTLLVAVPALLALTCPTSVGILMTACLTVRAGYLAKEGKIQGAGMVGVYAIITALIVVFF